MGDRLVIENRREVAINNFVGGGYLRVGGIAREKPSLLYIAPTLPAAQSAHCGSNTDQLFHCRQRQPRSLSITHEITPTTVNWGWNLPLISESTLDYAHSPIAGRSLSDTNVEFSYQSCTEKTFTPLGSSHDIAPC